MIKVMSAEQNIKRIWDLPTRLFHWALVATVLCSFISVKIGGNAMIWHSRFGYVVLALILFRLIWGVIGSHHSRFINFIKGPKSVLNYLKGSEETPGHSPIGALSVLLILGLFGFQAVSGLFASDEIFFDGPLVKYTSSLWVDLLTSLHRLNEYVLISVVVLHISAIFVYKIFKKINLITPMLTGDKVWTKKIPVSRDDLTTRIQASTIVILIALSLYYFLR